MPDGTSTNIFWDAYPDRFFDVGIAEGHGVTFAAGLSIEGIRPVVGVPLNRESAKCQYSNHSFSHGLSSGLAPQFGLPDADYGLSADSKDLE